MRRLLAVLTIAPLAALTACGSQVGPTAPDGAGAGESAARSWQRCTAEAFAAAGPVVTTLRHDGWASDLELKLPTDGPCAGGLVVSGPDGVVGVDVAAAELDAGTVEVLTAGSVDDSVLVRVDGGVHPRGGFQPHLYVVGPDAAREVTSEGGPVVPFVATDGGMAPLAVHCGGRTLEVLSATTSEPPGIILAWDVHRTTYDLTAGGARKTGTATVEEDAADPILRKDMPELFDTALLFDGC